MKPLQESARQPPRRGNVASFLYSLITRYYERFPRCLQVEGFPVIQQMNGISSLSVSHFKKWSVFFSVRLPTSAESSLATENVPPPGAATPDRVDSLSLRNRVPVLTYRNRGSGPAM